MLSITLSVPDTKEVNHAAHCTCRYREKTYLITVWYACTALAWCIPGLILTGLSLPLATSDNVGAGDLLAAVHALILGVLVTAACGVLWQFVPIAFQAQPLPRHVLYWHLPLHTLSVLIMVIGFIANDFASVTGGA